MSSYIASLDSNLKAAGEDVMLRRTVKQGSSQVVVEVTCRAAVRSVSADEIAGTIAYNDLTVIISPTQIVNANWPGADGNIPAGNNVDQRLPKTTDKVVVQGRERQVKVSKPIFVANEWVRTDLVVAG